MTGLPTDPTTVSELLMRVDAGWASFMEAVRALDEDEWDDEVPGGGWTRRKMLNHIRVWHEITAQRLRAFRDSGERPPSPGDEDTINAQAAADADLRSNELILRELDESFARLRAEVSALRDEQLPLLDGWPVGVVAGNTYGHYDDHRADVSPTAAG
jgi:hypothetical protein